MDTFETKVEDVYTQHTNGEWTEMKELDQGYLACGTQVKFDQEQGITGWKITGCLLGDHSNR